MKSIDLLEIIGGADDSLIKKADEEPGQRYPRLPKWGFIAACFCICAAAVILSFGHGKITPAAQKDIEETCEVPDQDLSGEIGGFSYNKQTDGGFDSVKDEVITYDGIPSEESNEIPHNGVSSDELKENAEVYTKENVETVKPTSQSSGFESSGPYVRVDPDGTDTEVKTETCAFISSFGPSTYDENTVVKNGNYLFSDSLSNAVKQYGSSVRYRVIVKLFRDGTEADMAYGAVSEEIDRMCSQGFTVAYETMWDGRESESILTLHASEEQLDGFSCSGSYGYYVFLYGELYETEDLNVIY